MAATFVLVHGAWFGGWCWRRVTPLLRGGGHRVFTPTLTGLGERAHLFTPEIDLDTHVTDLVSMLEFEELTNVVLVGHSYAGMVITGAAQKAAYRLRELVYLDAFLPEDGTSLNDFLPEPHLGVDGRAAPLDVRTTFNITRAQDLNWILPRLRDQPAKTFSQPVVISEPVSLRQTYIQTSPLPPFVGAAENARRRGFRSLELMSAHHCPMVTQPEELVSLLLTSA